MTLQKKLFAKEGHGARTLHEAWVGTREDKRLGQLGVYPYRFETSLIA